jgi:DNA-directed RNA polymerase
MKIESEAWQKAIQEYKDTLEDMCKHQLAPNLPFMKSMFLSWFEPLVHAITAEQEAYQKGEYRLNRSSYGPYLALLPADKLAVITMHKTVAKLLTEDANVGLRVIVPVLSIGEAVEQEVSLCCTLYAISESITGVPFEEQHMLFILSIPFLYYANRADSG